MLLHNENAQKKENITQLTQFLVIKIEYKFRNFLLLFQFKKKRFFSQFTTALSDTIRMGLLYKYGGIYTDTDTVAVKSIDLAQNFFLRVPAGIIGELNLWFELAID